MSIKDNIISHIIDCITSKETWNVLKGLYESTNENHILFLKTKIFWIKIEGNESINHFISCIKDLRSKLGDIGKKVYGTDLVSGI